MSAWFADRRVQFAIGLAVVLVAAKWLFTGSLLYTADTLESGETGSVTTAVVPLVLDILVGALIGIGAWVVNLVEVMAGKVKQQTSSQPTGVRISNDSDAMRSNVIALGNAVAVGDTESIEPLMTMIRQPFAIRELSEAYSAGEIEKAELLSAELKKMHENAPVKRSAK